jgi:glutamate---cysteine ligase / carboxylate-amine ligase
MPNTDTPFTIGIEEELLLVDKKTRAVIDEIPPEFMQACKERYPTQIVGEFLRTQVEIISQPASQFKDLKAELKALRQTVHDIAGEYGLAPIAASTHPFSAWQAQSTNEASRYQQISKKLNAIGWRLMVGGMHIHVGIDDESKRLNLLNRLSWYLPHILALSTSSPFWQGKDTGLNSFRMSVIQGLPRSGPPHYFETVEDYHHFIEQLIAAESIQDASEVWWDARLSCKFPTIEMRISDICTYLDDTIAIAAFYRCLMHHLYHQVEAHEPLEPPSRPIIHENRWRAERHPIREAAMMTGNHFQAKPYTEIMADLLEQLQPEAETLGCVDELKSVQRIIDEGTSADKQRQWYQDAIKAGQSEQQALETIVDKLIEATVA